MSSFSSNFQTLILHFLLWYFLYELLMSLRSILDGILGLQPRNKVTMLVVVNTIKFFSNNLHETGFCSQRREMLLFLTTNMAAVTSPTHQQISLRLTEIVHFVYAQRFLKPSEKDQRRSLMLSWIQTRTNQKVKSDILTGLVSRITLVLYFAGSSGGLLL